MLCFSRYIGIDYSGAETPDSSLKGLRVYLADFETPPQEVAPTGTRKYWSRRELAYWLADRLREDCPTLVGIDHSFSFPLRYFESHHLPPDWVEFLDDFQHHWPTDAEHTYVDFVRDGVCGTGGTERTGSTRWRRLTEERCRAKSVFHFDVPGSVAKSTHAGLPWLRYLRQTVGERVHFWPFDGWAIPPGKSAIAEAYPSMWKGRYPVEGRTPDQRDAYAIAALFREMDAAGDLSRYLEPELNPAERAVAGVEGWILGVV